MHIKKTEMTDIHNNYITHFSLYQERYMDRILLITAIVTDFVQATLRLLGGSQYVVHVARVCQTRSASRLWTS